MGPIVVPKWFGVSGDRWIWCLTLDATSNVFTNAKKLVQCDAHYVNMGVFEAAVHHSAPTFFSRYGSQNADEQLCSKLPTFSF